MNHPRFTNRFKEIVLIRRAGPEDRRTLITVGAENFNDFQCSTRKNNNGVYLFLRHSTCDQLTKKAAEEEMGLAAMG